MFWMDNLLKELATFCEESVQNIGFVVPCMQGVGTLQVQPSLMLQPDVALVMVAENTAVRWGSLHAF